jgi:hypothetical protein
MSEKTLEVLSDFANGLEAISVKLKHDVAALATGKQPTSKAYDPERIAWIQATGPHGPFDKATAEASSQCEDFVFLLEDLKAHNGTITKNGLFYWLFKEGPTTIGRKLSRQKQ